MSWSWSSNKMFCLFPTEEEGTQLANAVSNICRQIEKREQFLKEITEAENKELAWNWIWNSGFFCLSLILFQYFDILKGKLRKILVGSPSGERQKRARCVLSYSIFFPTYFISLLFCHQHLLTLCHLWHHLWPISKILHSTIPIKVKNF